MGPFFTSRTEWRDLRPSGLRSYLRTAVGYTLNAGALGLAILIVVCGAIDPHWRSVPVIAVSLASLLGGGIVAYALFRREWLAAEKAYGPQG